VTTSKIDTSLAAGITLTSAVYSSPLTITSGGTISNPGIVSDFNWTIQNAGSVAGNYYGIRFSDAGGSIGNTGTITGGNFGIFFTDAYLAATVDNAGFIQGRGGAAPFAAGLYGGGEFINEASGTATGDSFGVVIRGAYGTIDNSGTIGGGNQAVFMGAASSLLIDHAGAVFSGNVVADTHDTTAVIELASSASAGTLSGLGTKFTGFGTLAIDSGASWSIGSIYAYLAIDNSGTVTGATDGLYLADGGSVTNEMGGSISGTRYGINFTGNFSAAVQNAGTISGTGAGGAGIYLKHGGSVTNASTGSIGGAANGLRIRNATATVDNSGTITGTSNAGVYLTNAGSVTNESGGSIGGGVNGVYMTTVPGTVDNSGRITGTSTDGVRLDNGGSVTNETGASIRGGMTGIYILSGAGTVDNSGTIAGTSAGGIRFLKGGSVTNEATGSISGGADGVYIRGATGTIDNLGTITGGSGNGVYLYAGGSVTNENTGSIGGGRYGVEIFGTSATVENAGTISGGSQAAILDGSGTNRLIVNPGAKFTGAVVANSTAVNTLELTSGAATGTISGFGAQYLYFQTVAIDSGAAWTVGGVEGAFSGTTIQGFNSHDRLDLTNLTFNAGDTATVNGSNKVVITDAGGNVTIQMDSAVTGDLFKLVSDGHTGTFLEETNYTPCFLRGTLVLTAAGEVPVEDLRIGDRVITAGGETLRLKWIGRRAYRDWLALGNPEVQPILFKAGSIADHVPVRDLYVSPEHAMFIDGALIPARHLVNGTSIRKMAGLDDVEYFHLEFDRHVIILAEGAPSESFVDDDSRMLFHNADEYRRLYPDENAGGPVKFCAPRVECGNALEHRRRRLDARARRLRPDGTATPIARTLGYVDQASRTSLEGWAFAGAGVPPLTVAILLNGALVGEVSADLYRADLKAAGLGDGHCGFRFDLPAGLEPHAGLKLEVLCERDWTPIPGGYITI
jgi:hypothetical protein